MEIVEVPTPAPVEISVSRVDKVVIGIAQEVAHLSNVTSASTDVPLMLAGLNSITIVHLYFWLQEKFDYGEDLSRIFEEDITVAVVAREVVGEGLAAATAQEIEVSAGSSLNRRVELATDTAHEVARLAKTTSPSLPFGSTSGYSLPSITTKI